MQRVVIKPGAAAVVIAAPDLDRLETEAKHVRAKAASQQRAARFQAIKEQTATLPALLDAIEAGAWAAARGPLVAVLRHILQRLGDL